MPAATSISAWLRPEARSMLSHEVASTSSRRASKPVVCSAMKPRSSTPLPPPARSAASASNSHFIMPFMVAMSPPIFGLKYVVAIGTERPVSISAGSCGEVKRSRPRSGIGFSTTIGTPRSDTSRKVPSMRGWLVPGLWPMQNTASACSKSSSCTVPLPTPIASGRPTLEASWHMFEQSGKLLQPYSRANSWYRKAASLEARPEA
jgi:hypothetical protein